MSTIETNGNSKEETHSLKQNGNNISPMEVSSIESQESVKKDTNKFNKWCALDIGMFIFFLCFIIIGSSIGIYQGSNLVNIGNKFKHKGTLDQCNITSVNILRNYCNEGPGNKLYEYKGYSQYTCNDIILHGTQKECTNKPRKNGIMYNCYVLNDCNESRFIFDYQYYKSHGIYYIIIFIFLLIFLGFLMIWAVGLTIKYHIN